MNPFEGYRVTSAYGPRIHPVRKKPHFHTGIDLVKAHKSPIYAFVDGVVTFSGWGSTGSGFGNYGNVVAVLDADKRLHCYCHLDSVSVKVGDLIKRGQEVGKQGNTGVGTGSHLHYEIRKRHSPSYGYVQKEEDRAFEPTQYLIDWYKREEEVEDELKALEIVKQLEERIAKLEERIEAPAWFKKEFPGVAEKVHDPMELLGWRAVAVALRALK